MPQEHPIPFARVGWLRRSACCAYCLLCAATTTLAVFLLISILLIGLKVPLGIEAPTVGVLFAKIYKSIFIPFAVYFGEVLKLFLPWAIIVSFVLLYFAEDESRLKRLFGSFKTIKFPGGFELEGGADTAETFKEDLGQTGRDVKELNQELQKRYEQAKTYARDLRDRFEIDRYMSKLAEEVARIVTPAGCVLANDYRLTLHVPDFVFSDRLYQFAEYFDAMGQRLSNDRLGRTFSTRYGIIGRVWRSGVPEIAGDVISDEDRLLMPDMTDPDYNEKLYRFIARRWGLTLQEAVKVSKYKSYGAFRIEQVGQAVGVLFFDSKQRDAFAKGHEPAVSKTIRQSELVEKLVEVSRESAQFARLQIYPAP
jgi:hypothetical protein